MADFASYVRESLTKVSQRVNTLTQQITALKAQTDIVAKMADRVPSITEEIDKIPGRRIFYNLNGTITFDISDDGRRGQPINFLVSQDGPFVMTHYPMAVWRPSAPDTATAFGLWRPVAAGWPLPLQASAAGQDFNTDLVAISWEMVDAGSQRNFQNLPTPAFLSRPDQLIPLSVPTLLVPNATAQFFPTYERILFNNAATPPTEGTLAVALPGYRIVNM
ncbi:MAG: hypothetical protein R3322_00300 [Kiloniellales bacterium]|nr:hypothetical protein [Kiloniellales bacterium]